MFNNPNLEQSEKGEKIELHFACRNLTNLDGAFGKSDPIVKVFLNEVAVGKTEGQTNEHNPTFQKPVELLYAFEKRQKILVKVLDVDSTITSDEQ